jgi:hypothetical protein
VGDDPVQIFFGRLFSTLFQSMEQIELKDLLLIGERPVEGHQAETGQVPVFREILLKRGK